MMIISGSVWYRSRKNCQLLKHKFRKHLVEETIYSMKISWKKQKSNNKRPLPLVSNLYPNLPFDQNGDDDETGGTNTKDQKVNQTDHDETLPLNPDELQLAQSFESQGNKLAEDGRYREALGKWEAALTLTPDRAVLHEQKAQILLEIGDSWKALKAATRATELDPSWAEAWITLARAQLNYGEPDAAIGSFERGLAIKPDSKEAQEDKQTAMHLVKRRKQLHLSGLSETENRFMVGEKAESS